MQINQTTQQIMPEPCMIVIDTKDVIVSTFESVIIKAVDAAFSGLDNKQAVFCQLETKYSLSLLDIADNIEAFEAALKECLARLLL
jgi:hypothetical protein